MKPYTIWIHPEANVEDLHKVPEEFRPFDIVQPTHRDLDMFRALFRVSDDDLWPKDIVYIVKN